MKRLPATLCCFVVFASLLPTAAWAQGIHHGPKGGINFSTFRGEFDDPVFQPITFGYKAGFTVGWHFIFEVDETVALQPELYWSRHIAEATGSIQVPNVGAVEMYIEPTLEYVEFPILLKFSVNTRGSATPILFGGPMLAINTRADLVTIEGGEADSENIADDIETVDFGFVFGGGVELPVGDVLLSLDARYTLGLKRLQKPELDEPGTGDFKTGSFSILFGVII